MHRIYLFIFFACTVCITVFGPFLANVASSWYYSTATKPIVSITPEELAAHTGLPGSPGMYLSILGKVYDVKGGEKHYGPGSSYNFFIGRDASKAFITGDFVAIDDDDVLTLQPGQIQSLVQWAHFYETRYRYVGNLVGKFYDADGGETEYLHRIRQQVAVAEEMELKSKLLKMEYPPCNVEWTAEAHTRVWCTAESGGVARDWIGVPRKMFEAGLADWRCACVNGSNRDAPNVLEFDDCHPDATSCTYNAD